MTQATHTPGPYRVEITRWGKSFDRKIVAGSGTVVAVIPDGLNIDMALTNTHLLAAAPDLLAALETIAAQANALDLPDKVNVSRMEAIARAAIARAKGAR